MQIPDVTKEEECCCSCKYNIRVRDSRKYIYCYCALDNHYIGYVANFESVCERWEKDENR